MPTVIVKYTRCLLLLLLVAAMASCSITKSIPPDRHILVKNTIVVDKEAPADERITTAEYNRYIRQNPTKKLFGTNIPAWIYSQADPEKNNGWNNMLRRWGSEPVLLDTTLTQLTAADLNLYMNYRGFFDAENDYQIKYKPRQRAEVIYRFKQGEPYHILSIDHEYNDNFIEKVLQDDDGSLLAEEEIFDITKMDKERNRIATLLQNKGFYNFSPNNITYVVDTTIGNRMVDVTMEINKYTAGYDAAGAPMLENHSIYKIRDIYVFPDYNATDAASDPLYMQKLDTVEYMGLKIISKGKPNIRPSVLRRTIGIQTDNTYSKEAVQQLYNSIIKLGFFKSANISFVAVTDEEPGQVTYVGGDDDTGEAYTSSRYIDCVIRCIPALRQSYLIDLEGYIAPSFYGLKATVSYQNRNLFRGAELFDVSVTGGFEFGSGSRAGTRAFEVGGAAAITIPRFIIFGKLGRSDKIYNPRTRFEVSINQQDRRYYERTISSAAIAYTWSNARHSSYSIRPISLNLIKMSRVDDDFFNDITNDYLRESYSDQLVAGITASYVYHNPKASLRGNTKTLRAGIETSGNLINAITYLSLGPKADNEYYTILNIRYAQYFRFDLSYANKLVLGNKTSLVYRLAGGIGITYGNSQGSYMPIDRLFYVGGSNSMRGWMVRTLGPGSSNADSSGSGSVENGYYRNVGNMKLEANLEFRFPIWGSLRGATFFDVGNVWYAGPGDAKADEVFRFDRFYEQLGFNTGLGLRLDLQFAIIRLDWGVKLYDPSSAAGKRWRLSAKGYNTTFNFAIGYPF